MDHFDIRVTRVDSRADIAVRGELDESSADRMGSIDLAELSANGCRDVAVDLGDVEFLDSSGIGSLVGLHNAAVRQGLTLRITVAPDHVRHTLTMAGLAPMFGLT